MYHFLQKTWYFTQSKKYHIIKGFPSFILEIKDIYKYPVCVTVFFRFLHSLKSYCYAKFKINCNIFLSLNGRPTYNATKLNLQQPLKGSHTKIIFKQSVAKRFISVFCLSSSRKGIWFPRLAHWIRHCEWRYLRLGLIKFRGTKRTN